MVTFLAVVVGLFVGAILIIVTTPATLHAWGNVFSAPGHALASPSPPSAMPTGHSSPVR